MHRAIASRVQHFTTPFVARSARLLTTTPPRLDGVQPKDKQSKDTQAEATQKQNKQSQPKSQLQQDDELMQKMKGLAGDGGEAGVEYENGVPADMKRSVRNNMFRYI
ncbi:hypothetical protein D0862_05047 [Hortaea werneckii]|uniref:Uncharacterized protein n=1 Tax=Hortaea werneckii TaxID=91943 RepID=A0A3M7GX81_HORWE|nr:hypothetical protein D0862_05047 [Hortaea werneckii]